MNNTKLVIHLISDSTGETLRSVGAAAAAQFENLDYEENVYPLIRSKKNLERVDMTGRSLNREHDGDIFLLSLSLSFPLSLPL